MLSLLMVAMVTGILTAYVVRRTTDAVALRETRNRMQANLLEFRLFFDEPGLVWRAQVDLLRDNLRLLRLLLPSMLILALPMTWLFLQLDVVYGRRPLRVGEPALVTAQLTRAIAAGDRFDLQGSGGVRVETPPVRVFHDHQVVWRIRPTSDAAGVLYLHVNGAAIGKTVATGDFPKVLSPRRTQSVAAFVLHPEEARLPESDVGWVEVEYPGTGASWMVWMVVVSTAAALLSARLR